MCLTLVHIIPAVASFYNWGVTGRIMQKPALSSFSQIWKYNHVPLLCSVSMLPLRTDRICCRDRSNTALSFWVVHWSKLHFLWFIFIWAIHGFIKSKWYWPKWITGFEGHISDSEAGLLLIKSIRSFHYNQLTTTFSLSNQEPWFIFFCSKLFALFKSF